ncbi:hypothetical protein LCGC14_1834640 [marine sediment metagenome]|uniref:Uncharacterized protein n=1 Tax=marine sediment metagenome TaxID=412755 RepID=A0A0F9H386_9ZZZZ
MDPDIVSAIYQFGGPTGIVTFLGWQGWKKLSSLERWMNKIDRRLLVIETRLEIGEEE